MKYWLISREDKNGNTVDFSGFSVPSGTPSWSWGDGCMFESLEDAEENLRLIEERSSTDNLAYLRDRGMRIDEYSEEDSY